MRAQEMGMSLGTRNQRKKKEKRARKHACTEPKRYLRINEEMLLGKTKENKTITLTHLLNISVLGFLAFCMQVWDRKSENQSVVAELKLKHLSYS